jgi:hypothetical protein
MKFAIYGPPEITRLLVNSIERRERRHRKAQVIELRQRANVAMGHIDDALRAGRVEYGPVEHLDSMPEGYVCGRGTGRMRQLPDGTVREVETFSGGGQILSVW